MELFRSITSGLIGGMLLPFEMRHAMLSLIPISLLLGVGMLWVFRRTSNQKAIRATKRRLQAHLYELRLFTDEPGLVWQAQKALLRSNLLYIGLMLVPAIILTAPMLILFAHLEAFYGLAPLPVGREAVITIEMKQPLDRTASAPVLEAPAGITVESPAVRVFDQRQVSWRIRPLRAVSGYLRIRTPDGVVEKKIDAGPGPRYLSDRRVSSAIDLLWHPTEKRLPEGRIDWIEVRYPAATIHWLGLDLHWIVWLLIFSMASALALKRRFRVSF